MHSVKDDASNSSKPMSVSKRKFDVLPDGTPVNLYKMTNANGMQVSILDYGGTVKEILVPDRNGNLANVSLGFDNINDYIEKALILAALLVGTQIALPKENFL